MTEKKRDYKAKYADFTARLPRWRQGQKEREHVGKGLIFYKKTTKLGSVASWGGAGMVLRSW
ncbi:MAG: hypothetical protein WCW68_07330 [Methanothrix sp.]